VFEVLLDDLVEQQVGRWSCAAQAAFTELKVMLELDPWGGMPASVTHPQRSTRTQEFGAGREGLAGYVVIDRDDLRRVVIVEVAWLGG
jgi:hypothetical protein